MANMKINSNYFKFLLKNNRRMLLFYTLILLASYPLLVYFISTPSSFQACIEVGSGLNIGAALVASLIIPLSIFKFTTSKNSLDVFDALPITKESMFRLNYLTGLFILIVPFVAVWLIGTIYAIHFAPAIDFNIYMDYARQYTYMGQLLKLIEILIPLLLCYSITIFTKQNTGSSADAAIYTGIIHTTPMLAYFALFAYCSTTLLGFAEDMSYEIFQHLAPAVALFNALNTEPIHVSRLVAFTILSVILYIASSYLYVNHKFENCEKPFTNKRFYPLVSFALTLVILILLYSTMNANIFGTGSGDSNLFYPILISCLIYLVLDVIAHRGFKNLYRAALKFVFIALVSIGLLTPIELTQGFGYVTRIPDIQHVDSIEVQLPYFIRDLLGYDTFNSIVFEDQASIEFITNFHQTVLNKYKAYNYNEELMRNDEHRADDFIYTFPTHNNLSFPFVITYKMGNTELKRNYTIPYDWAYELLALADSESVIKEIHSPKEIEDYLNEPNYFLVAKYINYTADSNMHYEYDGSFDIKAFHEAYKKDVESRTQKVYELTDTPYLNIDIELDIVNANNAFSSQYQQTYSSNMYVSYIIENCDVNTIEYLNSIGINNEHLIETSTSNLSKAFVLFPDSNNEDSIIFHTVTSNTFDIVNKEINVKYKELSIDGFKAIRPYMRIRALYEEAAYIILTFDSYNGIDFFLVSKEHQNLIEDLVKDEEFGYTYDIDFEEQYLKY